MESALAKVVLSKNELTPETSAKILTRAIQTRAGVSITTQADGGRELRGSIIGGDETRLVLKTSEEADIEVPPAIPLRLSTVVSGRRYECSTQRVDPAYVPNLPTRLFTVARPATIVQVERRRSRRCPVPTTEITLSAPGSGSWRCPATILNLSADGCACRVPVVGTEAADVGRVLRAEFQVGDPPETFDLECHVVNRTPGGTPEHVLLGVEFVDKPGLRPQRARLQAALAGISWKTEGPSTW